jgi:predicted DNA-binding helix-hairpin-helix protein
VVGAAGESDLHILKAVDWIYRELHVFRSYYSAYQKSLSVEGIPPEPMEHRSSHPLLREHRLYQCDFLLRGYGFRFPDLVFDENGRVPENVDPKTAYAMMHPELYPVDVNRAEEPELLKVPGIGPVSARRIMESRRKEPLHRLSDLKRTGAWSRRAAPYVEFSGRHPDSEETPGRQPWLFEEPGMGRWLTDMEPYQKAKLDESGSPSYAYPGQTGKPYVYVTSKSQSPLTCR